MKPGTLGAAIRGAWEIDYAALIQAQLSEQKRQDLYDLMCQHCAGLGVVIDLENWLGMDPDGSPTYGGKRCEACDGKLGL